ncbi:MAG: hypothetical protein JNL28_16270 [Planctomycetes bacterium]|nr:hypothetical protein [Planctomycetota bacterium]MBL8860066.1 hypothetical protein [Planctomycetota bacterium]
MTKTKLLWSEQGEIACAKHAPYQGSDSRVNGRWRPIRLDEWIDFEAEVGRAPACETCAAIERNAKAVKP